MEWMHLCMIVLQIYMSDPDTNFFEDLHGSSCGATVKRILKNLCFISLVLSCKIVPKQLIRIVHDKVIELKRDTRFWLGSEAIDYKPNWY